MKFSIRRMAVLVLGCALVLSACGDRKPPSGKAAGPMPGSADSGKVLNLYIWSDYLAANTLSNFENQTGIKVHAAYFDTNETLETKLLAGNSGYDIVVPTASYFERQIKADVYLPLDKSKLPNLRYMDGLLMSKVALHDPGNTHGVIYMWGTNGIGYNEKLVNALLPKVPLDSWRLVFDPAVASKVGKCGISVLDSPAVGDIHLVTSNSVVPCMVKTSRSLWFQSSDFDNRIPVRPDGDLLERSTSKRRATVSSGRTG